MEDKKKRLLFGLLLIILIVILLLFNYPELFNFLKEDNLCIAPSCNPKDNFEYCVNDKWEKCTQGLSCFEGKCFSEIELSKFRNCNQGECISEDGEGLYAYQNGEINSAYSLTILKEGSGFGSINSLDESISCNDEFSECTFNYNDLTNLVLIAIPNPLSSTFSSWQGCDSVSNDTCIININSQEIVTVTFEFIPETH
ncbi:MAG: hypothetical protein AABW56_03060 [Nanoarchaeota archaeon]